MIGAIVAAFIIGALLLGLTLWVTSKAYSKKWDKE